MKVPLSWVREFVPLPPHVQTQVIVDRLVGLGFEVEGVQDLRKEMHGPIHIAEVLEIEEIKGQKKPIRYVKVAAQDERYVICGAQNFKVGDLVVLALPGALLPGNFAISARETYGKTSNGMICSARELGMGEDHSGIIVLDPSHHGVARGADAIALLNLDDVILDISVNPDRGYAMSIRGIAREIALAFNLPFKDPITLAPELPASSTGEVTQPAIEAGADYIVLRTIESVNVNAVVPLWMVRRLQMAGMRSISLAVDITNYIMLEYGQPLHAFDRKKISGTLKVRRAGKTKNLTTLDGQERPLHENDLLIADDAGALALAGTMGGLNSEVTAETTSITIEAAHFYPADVAKNARAHKLSTEASRRFERGVDSHLPPVASARAIELLSTLGGGVYVGSASDGAPAALPAIPFAPTYVSELIGGEYSHDVVLGALKQIGAHVEKNKDLWSVTPPSWRPDLEMSADLVEEVARIEGYEKIPSILPQSPLSRGLTPLQKRRRRIAQYLADRGLLEVQTYPFISPETIELMGFKGARARTFRIANPISEKEPLLRPHIAPGLIDVAVRNMGRGAKSMALFEIGSIFRAPESVPPPPNLGTDRRPSEEEIQELYRSVPEQLFCVGVVLIGDAQSDSWLGKGRSFQWQDAVGLAVEIIEVTGHTPTVHKCDLMPWHPGRCAELRVNGTAYGHVGELHPRVLAHYGLPPGSGALMVNIGGIPMLGPTQVSPLSNMVPTIQDVALVVSNECEVADLISALHEGGGEFLERVELFDRYTGKPLAENEVSYAFTLTFRTPDRSLTAEEAASLRDGAVAAAAALGARLRS
jgi:phenylalanyl-tRNA synthetase beta chain